MLLLCMSQYSPVLCLVLKFMERIITIVTESDVGTDFVLPPAEDCSVVLNEEYLLGAAPTVSIAVYLTERVERDVGHKKLLSFIELLIKLIRFRDDMLLLVGFQHIRLSFCNLFKHRLVSVVDEGLKYTNRVLRYLNGYDQLVADLRRLVNFDILLCVSKEENTLFYQFNFISY